MLTAAVALGLGIGLVMGMLGGGGSIVALPVLVYLLGETAQSAATGSLLVVGSAAAAGVVGQALHRRVCWRAAVAFAVAAAPSAVAGTALGQVVSGTVLLLLFAGMLLVVAVATWKRSGRDAEDARHQPGCPPLELVPLAAAGAVVGLLTGFFGMGGGFVIVPVLSVVFGYPMRQAIGTSLAVIVLLSTTTLIVHLEIGEAVDWTPVLVLAAAGTLGALAGSRVAEHLRTRLLGQAFALGLALIAGAIVVSSIPTGWLA